MCRHDCAPHVAVRRGGSSPVRHMASGSQLAPSSPLPHPLLEAKEDEHLHVRASSSSSAILPPPPRLPYDLTYPPLSPLGVDQNGHSLALQHPEQAAQVARAALMGTAATANGSLGAQQAVASSSSPAALQSGTANGGAEPSSKSSRTGAVTSHTASRHTPHEKPKKALPGQELEQHLVSEARGQRPMPWGLQVTLAEKAAAVAAQNGLAAQPNRTRMGTQKRNASRESRGGKLGLQSASPAPAARLMTADEDTASEFEASPRPPLLELQSEEKNSSLSLTSSEEPNGAQERRENGKSHSHDTLMTTPDAGVAIAKRPLVGTDQQSVAGPSTPRQSSPSVVAKEVLRSKKSRSSLKDVGAADHSMTGEGDDSVDSITGVRRPRAAHKRLKMIGGYYGKNAKVAALDEEVSAAKQPTVKAEADNSGGEPSGRVSRATSSVVEEDAKIGRVAPIAAPTTPVKKPHQPSLSIGILNSASKAQSSKLVIAASGASASVVDNTDGNNEYCETCHGVGHFICCDGCPRSFHFACLNPPMDIDELPSMAGDAGDEWYCNACASQRQAKSAGKAAQKRTLFGPLLRYIEEENPSIFSLPQDVRNYFKGVATANDGSYIDSTMLRPLKINKFGFVDERDPLRLKDRNGKLVLCYHCGQSALPAERTTPLRRNNPRKSQSKEDVLASSSTGDDDRTGWRKIIGCDFCSLHWHLDCLDPPLASMPSMARKWMCPNHVDHVVRPVRVPKNVANSTSVHDLPVPSIRSVGPGKHYRLRVINDGQIDIIPDPMDTYFGNSGVSSSTNSTTAVNGHDKKDEASSSSSRLTSSISGPAENRGRGLDKGWEEQDIPTNANGSGKATQSQQFKFKYRLPEKVIRLDFWSRAALERERTLAQLVQRQEEQARLPLDTLALAANAAATASADGHDAASSAALADVEAKTLVEQVFGAHSARPLFPALGVDDDDDDDDDGKVSFRDAEGNTWLESTLRQTYEPGVFEREAEAHAAALISPAHTLPAAKTMRWTRAMQEAKEKAEREAALDVAVDEATASAMQVDFDELKQLRAVKALLDRRGAKDVMQFLLR